MRYQLSHLVLSQFIGLFILYFMGAVPCLDLDLVNTSPSEFVVLFRNRSNMIESVTCFINHC